MTGIPRWMTPLGHGTEARARRHYRNGEKPCLACRLAANEKKALREKRKA